MIVLWILRQVYSFILNLFYIPYYWMKIIVDEAVNLEYKQRFYSYTNIRDLAGLVDWFKTIYEYKFDGPFGILDHDAGRHEFFSAFGMCEDVALYATKKLRALGFKEVTRVSIMSKWLPGLALHMDTFFKGVDGKYYLFNYGNLCDGSSLIDCFINLTMMPEWENYPYKIPGGKTQWIPHLWANGKIYKYPF